jgi:hypothetical protein
VTHTLRAPPTPVGIYRPGRLFYGVRMHRLRRLERSRARFRFDRLALLGFFVMCGCIMRDTRLEVHLRPEAAKRSGDRDFADLREFVESSIKKEGMTKARCFQRDDGDLCQYVYPESVSQDRHKMISIDAFFDRVNRSVEIAVLEHRDQAYDNAVALRGRLLDAVKRRFAGADCASRKALIVPTGIIRCDIEAS